MAVDPVPPGLQAVTPSLVVDGCDEAIAWYVRAFGASEVGPRLEGPGGAVAHAELDLLGCRVMLADPWPGGPVQPPSALGGSTMTLFLYTDDVDALWGRAVAAGAEVIYPLELQFYGDRSGRLRDPFGHTWGLGQHVEDVSEDEMRQRMAELYGG